MGQNFSPIKSRILYHIDLQGISKREFYKKTGIANGILDKSSGLTEQNIDKYCSTYPEINPDWLLTGNGPMLRDNGAKQLTTLDDDIVQLPVYNQSALANSTIEGNATGREYIKGFFVIPELRKADGVIKIDGNSMEPLYRNGDYVVVKKAVEEYEYPFRKVCVIVLKNDSVYIKYLHDNKQKHYVLTSENPEHEPIFVPKTDVLHIYRIIGHYRHVG